MIKNIFMIIDTMEPFAWAACAAKLFVIYPLIAAFAANAIVSFVLFTKKCFYQSHGNYFIVTRFKSGYHKITYNCDNNNLFIVINTTDPFAWAACAANK